LKLKRRERRGTKVKPKELKKPKETKGNKGS
jgi:hypothetical protein